MTTKSTKEEDELQPPHARGRYFQDPAYLGIFRGSLGKYLIMHCFSLLPLFNFDPDLGIVEPLRKGYVGEGFPA